MYGYGGYSTGYPEIVGQAYAPHYHAAVGQAITQINPAALAAAVQHLAASHPAVQAAAAQTVASPPGQGLAYGSAPRVVERPLTQMREFPLGFFQSGIGAGTGVVPVLSRPQQVFRGERLVIPSTVSGNFSVIDLKIGNKSQLLNSTQLPAQAFIETAIGVRLSMDTASPAIDVALEVQNTSAGSQTFQAMIIGTSAQ